MPPLRRIKTKIGELLLQAGLLTQDQLQEALSLQSEKEKGIPLGQILIDRGYVQKEDFYALLSIQCGYPYINLKDCIIDAEVLSYIPEDTAKEYRVFPVDKIQDILTIAMENPLDEFAINQLQKLTNSCIRVFLTSPTQLEEVFGKYFQQKKG